MYRLGNKPTTDEAQVHPHPIPFRLSKCKTRAGFSSHPLRPLRLDLARIRSLYPVIIDTPLLLVIGAYGIEVIVHRYGELIFKKSTDIVLMEKITAEIYSCAINQPSSPSRWHSSSPSARTTRITDLVKRSGSPG